MLDPMQPVPDSGTRILQVSRQETLESLKLFPLLTNTRAIVQTPAQSVLKFLSARQNRLLPPQSQCEYPQHQMQQLSSGPPHTDII